MDIDQIFKIGILIAIIVMILIIVALIGPELLSIPRELGL